MSQSLCERYIKALEPLALKSGSSRKIGRASSEPSLGPPRTYTSAPHDTIC